MNGLSADTARFAVAELLIKKIGEGLGIASLTNFSKDGSSPRAYFLGLNRITDSLHWVFINESYKISAFNKLPKRIQKQIQCIQKPSQGSSSSTRNQLEIKIDAAVDVLRETSREVLVVDPTHFLESPKSPQGYPIDETITKSILQSGSIDKKIGKLIPEIYTEESRPAMDIRVQIKDYHEKERLGLSMNAFHYNKVYFSPYAILDPRSCEPGYWDVLLGIETTIYLPIELDGTTIGVLAISQDVETAKLPGWDKPEFLEDPHSKIHIDNNTLKITHQYKYMTEAIAEDCEKKIQERWNYVKNKPEIRSGIKLLHFLFETTVHYYNEYTFNFDDTIVGNNLEITTGKLKDTLNKLRNPNQSSVKVITDYIEFLDLPTLEYIKSLQRIEPLLQNIGKKEHYIHMFNVFLLGRILWKYLFREYPDDKIWEAIALSHDITYPIEAISS